MRYDVGEREHVTYKAEKFGLHPGIAGVYIEELGDVFCKDCATDKIGEEDMERLRQDDLGYDHDKVDEFGNIAAVLSTFEWDCPGARCGRCGIKLDVRVAHYDEVCYEGLCPLDVD